MVEQPDPGQGNAPHVIIAQGSCAVIAEYTDTTVIKTHVWRSIHGGPGHFVNAKFSIKCLQRERLIYESILSHPNILTYYGTVAREGDGGGSALHLEWARYGTLRDMLTATSCPKSSYPSAVLEVARLPTTRWKWAIQLCSALEHLHANSFIHCDVSCRNILLTTSLDAKLADFGGSAILGGEGYVSEEGRYACPVHLKKLDGDGKYPTLRKDIFALGSAIYEIITGRPPYADISTDEAEAFYKVEKWPPVDGIDAGHIILQCWQGVYRTVQAARLDLEDRVPSEK